jgi:hypothetical protein
MSKPPRRFLKGCLDWFYRSTGIQIYRDEHGFYSPLPGYGELEATRSQWTEPSEMVGVPRDVGTMRERLERLVATYGAELDELHTYDEVKNQGLGEGFTILDSFLLYFMLRDIKPKRFVEIGAGFCTYYSSAALKKNASEGHECQHLVVEPNPWQGLRDLVGDGLVVKIAQDVPQEFFAELESGDVLFIDTSHVLKVGGEVAFLYLEVVPRLAEGVVVHAHDIHFPYTFPFPHERYIEKRLFPWVWTEAALLQGFFAFNDTFEILVSNAWIRHDDQVNGTDTLTKIPGVRPLDRMDFDTHYGSIWFKRVK